MLPYLLSSVYIRYGRDAGYESKLWMIEDDELGVRQETMVAFVRQRAAVARSVLEDGK